MKNYLIRCRLQNILSCKQWDKRTFVRLNYYHVISCRKPPSHDFVQSVSRGTTTYRNCTRFLSTPDYMSAKAKSCGNLSDDIFNLKTCEEVMNYLQSVDANVLTEDQVWLGLNQLFKLRYSELWTQNTVLHANVHIAYIQLLLQDRLAEVMKPVFHHEYFPVLCNHLNENYKSFDINKASDILFSLLYLGMPPTDPIITKLLVRMESEIGSLNLHGLVMLSHTLKSLPGLYYELVKQSLKQMRQFVRSNESPNVDDVYCVFVTAGNMVKFLSEDTLLELLTWFSRAMRNLDFKGHPEYIGAILRFLQSCIQFHPQNHPHTKEPVELLKENCLEHVGSFDSLTVYEVCRALKLLRQYSEPLKIAMERRACELQNRDLRISDVSNLMCALSKTTSNAIIRKFENTLFHKMGGSDAQMDSILLSTMTDSLLDLPRLNSDILRLYHRFAADHSETIVSYITRFNRVERLLLRYPFMDVEDEKRFVRAIVKAVENGGGLMSLTNLGSFLLSCQNFSLIPNHTHIKLISSLPHWNVIALGKLLNNINSTIEACSVEKRQHFIELLGTVQKILLSKVQMLSVRENLFLGTLPILSRSRHLDTSLSNYFMDSYIPLSEDSNEESVRRLSKFFSYTNFRIPQALDNFVDHAISNPKFSVDTVIHIVSACSKANYVPKRMNEFAEVVRGKYALEFNKKHYRSCLIIMNCLSVFKIYPEDELSRFFSLDVIQDLEKVVEETRDRGLERAIMTLNRSVTVERPNLNIPWFHEQYCQNQTAHKKMPNRNRDAFVKEVGSVLVDLLGDPKFFQQDSFSPFYHKIDFECALKKNNEPLSAAVLDDRASGSFQRAAICIQNESAFCKNTKILTGIEQLRKRQLETLNYRVIEVPFFEWFSMGLTEKPSKIKYMRDKINIRV